MAHRSDATPAVRAHHHQPMRGRDPHQPGRVATTLELLFDLTFVVAIGQAGNQLAHLLAEGHYGAAIGGFGFAMFAVLWAWVNFSWFASAFDTDDWIYRLTTMVQMAGVTVLGLGLPPMFHSLAEGHGIDNRLMVAGYVVMRVAMLAQWLRAAWQSPQHRAACLKYAKVIVVAQAGWVATCFVHLPLWITALCFLALLLLELLGPYLAETRRGGTPWHAHHIAERYGLLAIIALGEGVIGTVASLSAVVEQHGWSGDAVMIVAAGIGLTFGMWWVWFMLPIGELLHARRSLSFRFGYGSMPVLAAIAATGAGLHVAALSLEHEVHVGPVAVVLALTIPVAMFLGGTYLLFNAMIARSGRLHTVLLIATALVLGAAPTLAACGVSTATCLLLVAAAPAVSVLGYELLGHRHVAAALQELGEH